MRNPNKILIVIIVIIVGAVVFVVTSGSKSDYDDQIKDTVVQRDHEDISNTTNEESILSTTSGIENNIEDKIIDKLIENKEKGPKLDLDTASIQDEEALAKETRVTLAPSESIFIVSSSQVTDLHIYDQSGRHTGTVKYPNPESDMLLVKEEIPNSTYSRFGSNIYLSIPATGDYNVEIYGIQPGYSVLKAFLGSPNGSPVASIPIIYTKKTIVKFEIQIIENTVHFFELNIDNDGDDVVDEVKSWGNANL